MLGIQLMQEVGGCQGRKGGGTGKAGKAESWGMGETYKVRQPQTWRMCGKGKKRLNLA